MLGLGKTSKMNDHPTKNELPHLLLVGYSGELSLKSKGTRNRFSEQLARNVADALERAGIAHRVERFWSRILVRAGSARAAEVVARVFGASSVAPVVERSWTNLDDLLEAGREIFAPAVAGRTFGVRMRRGVAGQKLPFRSPEVERRLGALLVPGAAGVDLRQPEVWARIELRGGVAYFSSEGQDGAGGLPTGTEGRALALVSGGFDSVVAAWLLLRRGVRLDYLFLNLGGDQHRDGVLRVMKILAERWSHGYRPMLHVVDFRPVADELRAVCPKRLWQVILKRQMLRAGEGLVKRLRLSAMVTGEAVGQVSSQTLQNLAVIAGATQIPVLQPLIAMAKEEITALARRIGTFEASAGVAEYCALAPKDPETHAAIARVLEAEEGLDSARLETLVEERTVLDLRALDLERLRAPDLEIDTIPDGAVVVDLRTPQAYRSWHLPGAERRDYAEAVGHPGRFEPGRVHVFYCEVGLKSAHLAELLHARGIVAYHLRGGLRHALRLTADDPALVAVLSPVVRD